MLVGCVRERLPPFWQFASKPKNQVFTNPVSTKYGHLRKESALQSPRIFWGVIIYIYDSHEHLISDLCWDYITIQFWYLVFESMNLIAFIYYRWQLAWIRLSCLLISSCVLAQIHQTFEKLHFLFLLHAQNGLASASRFKNRTFLKGSPFSPAGFVHHPPPVVHVAVPINVLLCSSFPSAVS